MTYFSFSIIYNFYARGDNVSRKGLKIPVIIFTILSSLAITFSFNGLINMLQEVGTDFNQGIGDAVGSVLSFIFMGLALFSVIGILLVLSSLSILFCSIDLNKSINYNENIAFDIVFMSVNFFVYVFVVRIILSIV